jgi:hypothetical protein
MTTLKATRIVFSRWVSFWSTAASLFIIFGILTLGLLT